MIALIKVGTVSYICQKALRCFGKKDYADIIAFCGWCAVGLELYSVVMGIYAGIVGSELFSLVAAIGSIVDKIIAFLG